MWCVAQFSTMCTMCMCYFTKSNTPPWVFFTLFKFYEQHQIAQTTTHSPNTINAKSKVILPAITKMFDCAYMSKYTSVMIKQFYKQLLRSLFNPFTTKTLTYQNFNGFIPIFQLCVGDKMYINVKITLSRYSTELGQR